MFFKLFDCYFFNKVICFFPIILWPNLSAVHDIEVKQQLCVSSKASALSKVKPAKQKCFVK